MVQKSSQDKAENDSKNRSRKSLGIVNEAQKRAVASQMELQKSMEELMKSPAIQSATEAMRKLSPHLMEIGQAYKKIIEPTKQAVERYQAMSDAIKIFNQPERKVLSKGILRPGHTNTATKDDIHNLYRRIDEYRQETIKNEVTPRFVLILVYIAKLEEP